VPIYSLARLYWLAQEDRLNQVSIDTANQKIHFDYYNIYEGKGVLTLAFETLRIEIDTSKITWLFNPITIYFLKNKMEVFKATKWKDGFSLDTLNDMRLTLESLTSPVKN
jgi:hypothetical protein